MCCIKTTFGFMKGIPYSGLFLYGGHFRIFRIEEHHTTTKLFYCNRFNVTILSCAKIKNMKMGRLYKNLHHRYNYGTVFT